MGDGAGTSHISPLLPFHDENLATNDKVRRDTWEPHEWKAFKSRLPKWLRPSRDKSRRRRYWDCFVAYQMLFFLANNGMRVGEVVKVRRGDVTFYERDLGDMKKSDKGSLRLSNFVAMSKFIRARRLVSVR